jgi:hypothetical protein
MLFKRIRKNSQIRPPADDDTAQAWFWKKSWREGEQEASNQRDAGLGEVFLSDDEFLKSFRFRRLA